jgi:peptidoglycan/xylan/chitin deacetylase (PgdA/CDA1 family)
VNLTWLLGLPAVGAVSYGLLMSPYPQLLGRYPYRGQTSDRVIALTFDDGPNEPYTSQIAGLLEERGIRGTFFQVGRCVSRFPETTRRLRAAGHVVGNHSYTHQFHTYLVPGRFRREVDQTQVLLGGVLGVTPALVRTPWLWRQPGLLRMLRRRSLQPVAGVFAHAGEVFQPSATRMADRAIAKARPGAILIFHDGFDGRGGDRQETVEAVRLTADALLRQGYRFATVDEMLSVPPYRESTVDPTPDSGKPSRRPR